MASNNVRRDSWFNCKIKGGKAERNLPKGWNKSIRKRKAARKAAAQEILSGVPFPL
ncbi:hypothetical protein [Nitrosomonas ureae]|uniref:Uncharacterized protein n=1 Tax=Nitrosomonas ureae TaxID=44577 RepID=A0A1H9EA35_9PROT|nr:hypothetical protein [Nitrosomonas ureae]PXX07520.1 hypothetical protein C8R27_1517 [Nitrosomonas ureae]SEQ22551.1 hypothetical protein SAMN05421510_102928 [Nitrosomonas ureae]